MRIMMKVSIPVVEGNRAVKEGKLGETIQSILAAQKPEAVYFGATDGERTGYIIVNMQDNSEVPKFAEPWFLAFNAKITMEPVMVPGDLAKAGPDIMQAAKKYA